MPCRTSLLSGNQQIHRSMLCDDIQYVAVRKETFDLLLQFHKLQIEGLSDGRKVSDLVKNIWLLFQFSSNRESQERWQHNI